MTQKRLKRRTYLKLICYMFVAVSCRKLLEPALPPNQVTPQEAYNTDSAVNAVLYGLREDIMKTFSLLNGDISKHAGLAADELIGYSKIDVPYYNNNISADDDIIRQMWMDGYQYIRTTNDLVMHLQNNYALSHEVRRLALGEAYFFRALIYFYLANLYGGVPLVVTTDVTLNMLLPRVSVESIYQQIIIDLKRADMLPDAYTPIPGYANVRVHANRKVATALLARAYLFTKQWQLAADSATSVIGSPEYQLEPDLSRVFHYDSKEAIFQIKPGNSVYNTAEPNYFLPASPGLRPPVSLPAAFLQSFEQDDLRFQHWIDSSVTANGIFYFPAKYKVRQGPPHNEFNTVLRLGEQFLIRAEAYAMMDKLPEAIADLNTIRARANLQPLALSDSREVVLGWIERERYHELFCEWGHRWLDLKRWPSQIDPTNTDRSRADDILSVVKPSSWASTDKFWPIPSSQLGLNTNLHQNPGY